MTRSNTQSVHQRKKRATIIHVAEMANVSPSTVSLYLRRPEEVSDKLKDKIQKAIDALSYVPNKIAGGLSSSKSKTLCVTIPSLMNTFFAGTVHAMQNECDKAGYTLLIGSTDYNLAQEDKLVRTFLEWSPAGIILTGKDQAQKTKDLLMHSGIPIAQMWDIGAMDFDLQVGFDNYLVGETAAKHLYQGGCKNVVYLGARLDEDKRAGYRAKGYERIAALHQSQTQIIGLSSSSSQFSSLQAGEAIATALSLDPSIDGVICSNDSLALGVLFEMQRRHISVPDRLSIIGFGDLEFSRACTPALTTIRPHREKIGALTIRYLIDIINGNEIPSPVIDVHFELVPRQSTKLVIDDIDRSES